jgi:superfamily II DNA helicase RecQ
VVFDDKTLQAIVLAMPSNEQELFAVSGMGTKRIEFYGDEIIAALDAVRPGT